MDGSKCPFRNIRGSMHKSLTFTWISHFGLPEMITSDCEPQFTSSLWLQLCKMLNISHKQTTAYHPELNSAVKRLHRCLKDTLRVCDATATWSKELPIWTQITAEGRHWSFPGCGSFWCTNCLAKYIFAK
jgi:transposase InsO family protein